MPNVSRRKKQHRKKGRAALVADLFFHPRFRSARIALIVHLLVGVVAVPAVWYEFSKPYGEVQGAQTTTTFTADDDGKINKSSTTTNFGSDTTMELNRNGAGTATRRVLVKFDLSSIPSNATLTSATLKLFQSGSASGLSGVQMDLHRLTRGWTENQFTWNKSDNSTNWTTAGGDFAGTATASVTPSSSGSNGTQHDFTVTTDVASFVAGTDTNYGWVLKFNNESTSGVMPTFHTLESSTSGSRPQLTVTYTTPSAPTTTIVSTLQRRDGTGIVDITATVHDGEQSDVKMRVYNADASCTGDTAKFTLGSTVTATYNDSGGAPDMTGDNYYQIASGATTGIITSSGTNTIQFSWLAGTDVPNSEEPAGVCVGFGVNDGGLSASTTRIIGIDTKAPSAPAGPAGPTVSTSSITIGGWGGCNSTDNNFKEYKFHYGTSAGLTMASSAWTSSTYPGLANSSCTGISGATEFTGLLTGTTYYANLFAYDTYGNVSSSTSELSFTTTVATPGAPTVTASSTSLGALVLVVNNGGNTGNIEYTICLTTNGTSCADSGYLQTISPEGTSSFGESEVWQSYSAWGGSGGFSLPGLSANTAYQFLAQARRGGDGGGMTSVSSASAATYTLANQVTSVQAAYATVTSTLGVQLSWFNAGQTGLKIERDNGCDGTYDVIVYDNAIQNETSPTTTRSNLTAALSYNFRISSYNGGGAINSISPRSTGCFSLPPSQPQDVTASATQADSVTWSWSASSGITGSDYYDIYNSSTGALLSSVSADTTQYTQTGLTANTQYGIIVRGRSITNGTGIASSVATSYTETSVPTGLSHTNQSTTGIRWTWTNSGQSEFYAEDANTTGNNSGWTTNAYWDMAGLEANTAYTINVKARNAGLEETSNASITRYTSQVEPGAVQFIGATANSLQAVVSGGFVNIGVGSAAVVISNGAGASQSVTDGSSTWNNTGLTSNTRYTYTAYATNSDGDQTSSVAGTMYTYANTPGTPTAVPTSPTSLTVTLDRNSNPTATDVLIIETGTQQFVDPSTKTLVAGENYDTFANWDTVVVTGLTPNTGYRFSTLAKNGDGVATLESSASTLAYTLANTPANPRATADSRTSITLTWGVNTNPAGTEYYAENTSLGTNTGWVTSASWTITGLECGTTYDFSVKARNAIGTETDAATTTGETSACATNGGGGGLPISLLQLPRAPEGSFSISINRGVTSTTSSLIALTLNGGPDAVRMSISEDSAFASDTQIPYTKEASFRLSSGAGTKRVFVRFYTATGIASPVVSDTIFFAPSTLTPPVLVVPRSDTIVSALPFEVRGTATPGALVTVRIAATEYTVLADTEGVFAVTILDQLTSGSYTLIARQAMADEESREVTRAIIYRPAIGDETVLPALEEHVDVVADRGGVSSGVLSESLPTASLSPTTKEVAQIVEQIEQRRPAFLVVRSAVSTQFVREQVGPIEVAAEKGFDIVIRPNKPVHSVTARLYKNGTSLSLQETNNTNGSITSRLVSWLRPTAQAVQMNDGSHWQAAFVFMEPSEGGVYGGTIQLPAAVSPGDYRLVLTLNGIDGTRTHLTKQVSVLHKGTLTGTDGEKVERAKVTIYRQKLDNTYDVWAGEAFGQQNPILTDSNGEFLVYVPDGTYYLTIDSPGFEQYKSGVYVFDESSIFHEPIQLTPKKRDVLYRMVSWIINLF